METLDAATLEPRFATVADAADYLNIARSTVYELLNSGELPSRRIRRCRRIRWKDLEAFADGEGDGTATLVPT